VDLEQDGKLERELAVFSLALRLGRREIPDLPRASEMNRQEMSRAAELLGNQHFTAAATAIDQALREGVQVISCQSQYYPSSLLTILGAPEVLFVRGNFYPQLDKPCVAIVGSRKPTREGRDFAERLGYQIAKAGGAVISGLAYGCDAAAHLGAIRGALAGPPLSGGIAVLGSGVNRIYPAAHEKLALDLLNSGGAIVSESGVDSTPHRGCFPARNRIISGLASAVIVVEAGEKSGSLITARFAAEQSRDLYAVPGSFYFETCRGTNQLLKEGAIPLTDFSDLSSIFPKQDKIEKVTLPEDPILKCLARGESLSLEEFCSRLSSTPALLLPKLVKYELQGIVLSDGGRFSLLSGI